MTNYSSYSNIAFNITADWYGISGLDSESPDLIRVGNDMTLHASLPIQNNLKGCILNDDGSVNYYLKSDDWTKKVDNTASNLDGTDGQVMVEIPEHYYLDFDFNGSQYSVICESSILGFNHFQKSYISAYEATVQRSTNKLSSVKNSDVDYRGGNNNSDWDAGNNTLLGKSATSIPIHNSPGNPTVSFRKYAQNRGGYWYPYAWKVRVALQRLFMIEYATKDSQKAVNNDLTVDGYKQGGLGKGATTVNETALNNFNNRYPYLPIGVTDTLGNSSGEVSYSVPFDTPANTNVCRYRGIENIFGHVMELVDGIAVEQDLSNNRYKAWIFDDPADFKSNDSTNGRLAGYIPATNNGQFDVVTKLSNNDFIITETQVLPDMTTYFCDRANFKNANTLNTFNHYRTGGYLYFVGIPDTSGMFWAKAEDYYYLLFNYIGTRLCCLPNGY